MNFMEKPDDDFGLNHDENKLYENLKFILNYSLYNQTPIVVSRYEAEILKREHFYLKAKIPNDHPLEHYELKGHNFVGEIYAPLQTRNENRIFVYTKK